MKKKERGSKGRKKGYSRLGRRSRLRHSGAIGAISGARNRRRRLHNRSSGIGRLSAIRAVGRGGGHWGRGDRGGGVGRRLAVGTDGGRRVAIFQYQNK